MSRYTDHKCALLLCAVVILLVFLGPLRFGGDLGKWSDDWATCLRDPVSGEVTRLTPRWVMFASMPWSEEGEFFRPLFVVWTHACNTLLWEHDRLHHLLVLAMHGVTAFLLGVLVRRLGGTKPMAVVAGLTLGFCALGYQAMFWLSASATTLALALTFIALILAHAVMFSSSRTGPGVRSASWLDRAVRTRLGIAASLVVIAVLGLVIPCFNEQPAGLLLAVPVLGCFAVLRAFGDGRPAVCLRALTSELGGGGGGGVCKVDLNGRGGC